MTLLINQKLIKPIYTPVQERPMHLVVFGSGQGSNLEALLKAQNENPAYFEIKALFSDRQCRFQNIGHEAGIPVIEHSFHRFIKAKGLENGSTEARLQYDEEAARLILECAAQGQFSVDLILLAGYMRLIKAPLLSRFKVINVHPADLTVLDKQGKRRYVGMESVYDALHAGETQTRSCVILVDEELDGGPILVNGPTVTYEEGYPITKERAAKHQQKQKRESDWPACITAVQMIAQGRIALDVVNNVYVDNCIDLYEVLRSDL